MPEHRKRPSETGDPREAIVATIDFEASGRFWPRPSASRKARKAASQLVMRPAPGMAEPMGRCR